MMKQQVDPLFGAVLAGGWFPSPAHIMRRAAILDEFSAYPPGKLLEMGCGAGRLLADWSKLGHSGEAVDLDAEARQLAQQCVTTFGADFAVGATPADDNYDYLVATEVLEHIDDPQAALTAWAEHLRPGGTLLCTVPAFARLWGASDEWAGHVQRFEPDAFRRMVANAGFDMVESRLYGFPIGNLLRTLGNAASARKMRQRKAELSRVEATLASGRDRSIERKVAPVMRSLPGRAVLKLAIGMQRLSNRGHGLLVIAKKRGATTDAQP